MHGIDSVNLLANLNSLSPPDISLAHLYIALSPLPGKLFSLAYLLNTPVPTFPIVSPL